jgi:hypothetical protein
MSIFGNIMSAIFGGSAAAAPAKSGTGGAPGTAQQSPATPQTGTGAATATRVDVAGIMDARAKQAKQKLDWRKSIVDLMKLLDMDSSLAARKQLAGELHYTGDTNDSAKMNVWLHRQVMIKLAENGGRIPEELKN